MATGTTADFTVTRDKLIELGHKLIGVLEPGDALDGEQLQDGVDLLGMIVRETDQAGRWRWTIGAASSVTLAANVFVYTSANGLPTNIAELISASYRDSQGLDTPVKLIHAEGYEAINNKTETGEPQSVYLDENIVLASKTLRVWPMVNSVNAQSVVTGTDANPYKCVRAHVASAENRPVTGANYLLFWEAGGSGPVAWASGASYYAPQQIRLLFRRPIFDFDTASDTGDFPIQCPRMLLYKLAFDLGDLYGIPVEERNLMIGKSRGAYDDIFPSFKAKSTDIHNKVRFY